MIRHSGRYRHYLLSAFLWPFSGAVAGFILFSVLFDPPVSWLAATVIGGILGAVVSAYQVFRGTRTDWRHYREWNPSTGR